MQTREELERWIAESRATQGKLKLILMVGAAVALGLCFVNRAAGAGGVAIVAFVAVAGFWITGGHIAEWEAKIYQIDHPPAPTQASGDGRRRRYERD